MLTSLSAPAPPAPRYHKKEIVELAGIDAVRVGRLGLIFSR